MAEPVKCDYPLCGKAASRCGVCDRSSPSHVRPRTGLNLGHGHVWPRPDGVKARCGGPGLCDECSADAAQAKAATPSATATITPPPGPGYLIGGKVHRQCGCDQMTATCPLGVKRSEQTCGYGRCFIPVNDMLIVGTSDGGTNG